MEMESNVVYSVAPINVNYTYKFFACPKVKYDGYFARNLPFFKSALNYIQRKLAKTEDVLLVDLECPICKNYMSSPIHFCPTGHSVCAACRSRYPSCPSCHDTIARASAWALEALAHKIKYPCTHRSLGCTRILSLRERRAHEAECPAKEFKCGLVRCEWVGKREEVVAHWAGKGRARGPLDGTSVLRLRLRVRRKAFNANIVTAYGELFWLKYKIKNGVLYFAVQLLGNSEEAKRYRYRVRVCNADGTRSLQFSRSCKSAHVDNGRLFRENECIRVPLSDLQDYLTEGQVLNYTLKVRPEKLVSLHGLHRILKCVRV